jgi:predicted O-methyltransferase YrrM
MKNQLFIVKEYLSYFLKAQHLHGVHSPFAYHFNDEILGDKREYYAFQEIETLREALLKSKASVSVQDYGAGSHRDNTAVRKIANITKYAAKTAKHGQLLFKIVANYDYRNILELGTSMGIGAAYLAKANANAILHTIEGSPAIADQAKINFAKLGISNIKQYIGKFDEVLPAIIPTITPLDCVFIDGNHSYQPTINYFHLLLPYMSSESLLIFDDIHWSPEMKKAWLEIKAHPNAMMCIDVFQFGLVFFSKDFTTKQEFILR